MAKNNVHVSQDTDILIDNATKVIAGYSNPETGAEHMFATGIFADQATCQQLVNNNAGATVVLNAGVNFLSCTGTNATSVSFTLPAVASVPNDTIITIHSQAAISVASAFTSSGGTFLNAPGTMTAGQVVRWRLAGTVWIPC